MTIYQAEKVLFFLAQISNSLVWIVVLLLGLFVNQILRGGKK